MEGLSHSLRRPSISEGEVGCGDAEGAATGRKGRGRQRRRDRAYSHLPPFLLCLQAEGSCLAASLPRSFPSLTVPPIPPALCAVNFTGKDIFYTSLVCLAESKGSIIQFERDWFEEVEGKNKTKVESSAVFGDHYRTKYCGGGTDDPHYSLVDGTYTALQPCVSYVEDTIVPKLRATSDLKFLEHVEAHLTLQATLLEAERGDGIYYDEGDGNHHNFDSIDTFAVVFAVHVLGSHVFTHEVLEAYLDNHEAVTEDEAARITDLLKMTNSPLDTYVAYDESTGIYFLTAAGRALHQYTLTDKRFSDIVVGFSAAAGTWMLEHVPDDLLTVQLISTFKEHGIKDVSKEIMAKARAFVIKHSAFEALPHKAKDKSAKDDEYWAELCVADMTFLITAVCHALGKGAANAPIYKVVTGDVADYAADGVADDAPEAAADDAPEAATAAASGAPAGAGMDTPTRRGGAPAPAAARRPALLPAKRPSTVEGTMTASPGPNRKAAKVTDDDGKGEVDAAFRSLYSQIGAWAQAHVSSKREAQEKAFVRAHVHKKVHEKYGPDGLNGIDLVDDEAGQEFITLRKQWKEEADRAWAAIDHDEHIKKVLLALDVVRQQFADL